MQPAGPERQRLDILSRDAERKILEKVCTHNWSAVIEREFPEGLIITAQRGGHRHTVALIQLRHRQQNLQISRCRGWASAAISRDQGITKTGPSVIPRAHDPARLALAPVAARRPPLAMVQRTDERRNRPYPPHHGGRLARKLLIALWQHCVVDSGYCDVADLRYQPPTMPVGIVRAGCDSDASQQ